MTDLTKETDLLDAINLLTHYGFDLSGYTAAELIYHWLNHYPSDWLKAAVIEALYQGRYKAISIDQILMLWKRRGQPCHHFNHEFERMVCSKLPRDLIAEFNQRSPSQLPQISGSAPKTALPASDRPHPHQAQPEPEAPQAVSSAPVTATTEAIAPVVPETRLLQSALDSLQSLGAFQPMQTSPPPVKFALETDWQPRETPRQPIHQFVPVEEQSVFYSKLKAVSQQEDEPTLEVSPDASIGVLEPNDSAKSG